MECLLAHKESEMVSLQLAELQMSLKRNEHQINWKEEHFKQEIADLQQVRNCSCTFIFKVCNRYRKFSVYSHCEDYGYTCIPLVLASYAL